MSIITPSHIIAWFLEFADLVPNREQWHALKLQGNPPRLIRFQRLVATCRAFGLGPSILTLETGDFLLERELQRYAGLVERIQAEIRTPGARGVLAPPLSAHDLQRLYKRLLDFRRRLETVLEYNSGVLEAAGIHLFAYHHIGAIIQEIAKARPMADAILSQLISPEGEAFDEASLIEHHGFPKADIREIDMEWI